MFDDELLMGAKIKKIGEGLSAQIAKILSLQNIEFEPRALPLIVILNAKGFASITEIGNLLGWTHPAVVQLVNKLSKAGFISQKKSIDDKRMTILELTKKGKSEYGRIEPFRAEIRSAIQSILNDIDVNLSYSILKLNKAVKDQILVHGVKERLKQNEMREVIIVPYKRKYKSDFAKLNYEWLVKYFKSEGIKNEDERLLNNPEKEIIKKGGQVFFAILKDEVVGTCAVLKVDDITYELAKMGVTEKAQGKQIGKKLALTSIGYAVDKKAEKLILSTNPKLTAAMNLYSSLGFKLVKLEQENRYKRKLIHMELDLSSE